MSDFTRAERISAPYELSPGDDSAADSGAHGEIDNVGASFGRAEKPLGKGAAVGVVFKTSGHSEVFPEEVENRNVIPALIVGRRQQYAVSGVGGEGGGNAECGDLFQGNAGFGGEISRVAKHLRQNFRRIGVDITDSALPQQLAGRISEADADFGSADIEPEQKLIHVFMLQ